MQHFLHVMHLGLQMMHLHFYTACVYSNAIIKFSIELACAALKALM